MSVGLAEPSSRSLWSGNINIGLVNIPVKIYTMIRDKSFSFRMLRREDACPLKYQRVCTFDNEVVPWSEVVRGYEVRKDEYVIFTKEELEALKPESSKKISLDKFVPLDSVDPIFFEKSYILAPDKSDDSYSLFLKALRDKGKAGVGKFTLRTKEHLVLIHEHKGSLVLTTLRYAEEVVDPMKLDELKDLAKPSQNEMELAIKIIEGFSGDFDITEYHDTYQERVGEMVERKLEGKTIKVPEEPEKEEVKELMLALQETLNQLEGK
jgi:DNA end-binding protein Ku